MNALYTKFTFYVGVEYDKNDKRIDWPTRMAGESKITDMLTKVFGGFTRTGATGVYRSGKEEMTNVYTVFTQEIPQFDLVKRLSQEMADALNQSEVLFSVEPQVVAYFVKGSEEVLDVQNNAAA
jgi:hypothetical protein